MAVNTVVVVEVIINPEICSNEEFELKDMPFQVACWFFIGECIGKGSLVGYNV